MDVTVHNFKENFHSIQKAINEATFLAIDAEFTGLYIPQSLHAFDTPEGRYAKLRKGAMDFLLIQFGLCTFTCNEKLDRYEHKAFNFYVFPKPSNRNEPDVRFMCQSSSIDFLSSQGFDFNKLFKDGISYLSPVEECKLREQLEQKHYQQSSKLSSQFDNSHHDDSSFRSLIPIPDQNKSFIDDICKKIKDFMSSSSEKSLSLEPCNSFLRKLIFQTVKQRYPSGIYLESKRLREQDYYIEITKVSPEKLMEMEFAKKNAELEALNDAVGFSKIIKAISSSGKLVVGHNMLLDILHVIHKFCSPLPADFEDFKAITKCVFPRLLDTKLMSSTFPFKDKIYKTGLAQLFKTLENKPFSMPRVGVAEGFKEYNTSEEQLHEAGYDAYITGLCFLTMAEYLDKLKCSKRETLQLNWSLVEPFVNKLYMMRVLDIPYMNLVGEDLKPNRDHVFHVRFPKDWKTSDLIQLFGPFGQVGVFWVDDTSAFVALERKDQATLVMRTLTQSDIYHVRSYKEYARMQKKPNPYDTMQNEDDNNTEVKVHKVKRQMLDNTLNVKRARRKQEKSTDDQDMDTSLKECEEGQIEDDDEEEEATAENDNTKEDTPLEDDGNDNDDHSTEGGGDHTSDDKEKDEDVDKGEDAEVMVSGDGVDGDKGKKRKRCKRKVSKKKKKKAVSDVFGVPSDWY